MAFARTFLISLTMIVFSSGEESSCRMWSDHGNVAIEGNYVFCQCNISGIQSSDIKFMNGEYPYDDSTEIVDNITVKTKLPEMFTYVFDEFYCLAKKTHFSPKSLQIIPKLKPEYFKCLLYSNEYIVNCTFSARLSPKVKEIFFLSANGLPKVKCNSIVKQEYYKLLMCKIPINKNLTIIIFKIEMEIMGLTQHKEIILHRNEILIPNPNFIKVFHRKPICNCTVISSQYENLICRMRYNRGYPLFRHDSPYSLQDHEGLMCVFKEDLGYRPIFVKIFCRLRNITSWTVMYKYSCLTPAILPLRPPQILSNGFFYEPNHKHLYIFFFHLNVMDWNGPSFGYIAKTDHGDSGLIIGNNSVLFRNWDASLSATIYLWSKNSEGFSVNRSELKVPILTNDNQRPKNLQYDEEEHILSWDPPNDDKNIVGYTIYWCTGSLKKFQICEETKKMRMKVRGMLKYRVMFEKPQTYANMAVVAQYKDKIGGGMQWTGNMLRLKWNSDTTEAGISYYIAPIGVSIIIALFIYFYRKCRKCNDIEVILPEGLEQNTDIIPPPPSHDPVVIRGNISPEAIMDINRLMPHKETRIKNELQDDGTTGMDHGPEKNSSDTQIASGSYSKCPEISLDKNNLATNTESYRSCPDNCPQSGNSMASGSYSTLPVKSLKNDNATASGCLTPCPEGSFDPLKHSASDSQHRIDS